MILNCVTIDDEPLALGLLNSFIENTPALRLISTYNSTKDIIDRISEIEFELLFLDINMPGINGIEIARSVKELEESKRPKVIFTTAHNEFAVESYEVEALGYLLKPFEYHEFLNVVDKASKYYQSTIAALPNLLGEGALFVRSDHQQIKIAWEDIKFIQGLKDYVAIHLKSSDKTIVTLATLKSLEQKLPLERFRRIQKSYIVALDAVTSLSTNSVWIEDYEITIGEQYKKGLHAIFKKLLT
ncbi:LytR/AlgR family response regulator transcription factor [Sphingobacterium siyangense]|uniref:LytTR family two component transcriptional regulator n=1 Tax=Sphingobacterium siyangense TaxID=459529 RepID=A0A562M855_9SPHI|nr:LytTR family DNA-binding domain-containing protein [Sphingobacterium siyangense]TWI16136.1 LytTR family two component transcriptional regulator [Sphingobacterium siyangense]HAE68523.1 DNA-binding response regulator [Sphingobacterium sp.]